MVNSRAKGSKAERLLAKQLGDWTGLSFARTPSSGGLHWGKSFATGDIVCTTEGKYFPFSVEVKNYNELNVTELICSRRTKQDPKIVTFYKQCVRDAQEGKKIPLLFMKYNGLPKETWLVMFPKWYLDYFINPEAFSYNYIILNNLFPMEVCITDSNNIWEYSYKSIRKNIKLMMKNQRGLWDKLINEDYQVI